MSGNLQINLPTGLPPEEEKEFDNLTLDVQQARFEQLLKGLQQTAEHYAELSFDDQKQFLTHLEGMLYQFGAENLDLSNLILNTVNYQHKAPPADHIGLTQADQLQLLSEYLIDEENHSDDVPPRSREARKEQFLKMYTQAVKEKNSQQQKKVETANTSAIQVTSRVQSHNQADDFINTMIAEHDAIVRSPGHDAREKQITLLKKFLSGLFNNPGLRQDPRVQTLIDLLKAAQFTQTINTVQERVVRQSAELLDQRPKNPKGGLSRLQYIELIERFAQHPSSSPDIHRIQAEFSRDKTVEYLQAYRSILMGEVLLIDGYTEEKALEMRTKVQNMLTLGILDFKRNPSLSTYLQGHEIGVVEAKFKDLQNAASNFIALVDAHLEQEKTKDKGIKDMPGMTVSYNDGKSATTNTLLASAVSAHDAQDLRNPSLSAVFPPSFPDNNDHGSSTDDDNRNDDENAHLLGGTSKNSSYTSTGDRVRRLLSSVAGFFKDLHMPSLFSKSKHEKFTNEADVIPSPQRDSRVGRLRTEGHFAISSSSRTLSTVEETSFPITQPDRAGMAGSPLSASTIPASLLVA
jgi:hypothetical protein